MVDMAKILRPEYRWGYKSRRPSCISYLRMAVFVCNIVRIANAATCYLDAADRNDVTGDGSSTSPWQTFNKAKTARDFGDSNHTPRMDILNKTRDALPDAGYYEYDLLESSNSSTVLDTIGNK